MPGYGRNKQPYTKAGIKKAMGMAKNPAQKAKVKAQVAAFKKKKAAKKATKRGKR